MHAHPDVRDERVRQAPQGQRLLDPQWYLDRYPDVALAGFTRSNIRFWSARWRGGIPVRNSTTGFYVQQNPDFSNDRSISPLEHYLHFGRMPASRARASRCAR